MEIEVGELIKLYKESLFQLGLYIEYRDEENYFIQECRYESYEKYLKYDSFKNCKIKEWFIKNQNKIILLVNKKHEVE